MLNLDEREVQGHEEGKKNEGEECFDNYPVKKSKEKSAIITGEISFTETWTHREKIRLSKSLLDPKLLLERGGYVRVGICKFSKGLL